MKELIDSLIAQTPAAIRRLLQSEEITGVPKSAGCCPISRYIDRQCSQYPLVTHEYIYNMNTREYHYITGTSLSRFIKRFDRGFYPELTERREA